MSEHTLEGEHEESCEEFEARLNDAISEIDKSKGMHGLVAWLDQGEAEWLDGLRTETFWIKPRWWIMRQVLAAYSYALVGATPMRHVTLGPPPRMEESLHQVANALHEHWGSCSGYESLLDLFQYLRTLSLHLLTPGYEGLRPKMWVVVNHTVRALEREEREREALGRGSESGG